LSRFCDIYIPETIDHKQKIINLHQHTVQKKYLLESFKKDKMTIFCEKIASSPLSSHKDLVILVTDLYECGYSCLDVIDWIKSENERFIEKDKSAIVLVFHKIKSEYRCEKMLMLYIMDFAFLRQNKELKNIGFM